MFPAVVCLLADHGRKHIHLGFYTETGGCLLADHGRKHIHLGFYKETGGCDCSSTVLLMMGKMLPETC
jgi:hypothetical protein